MRTTGFTLAELLIALAILGVIATFTIPKVLQSQQNSSSKARAKEVVAMISGAFQQLQLDGKLSQSTNSADLSPYLNYVKIETSYNIDNTANAGTVFLSCDASSPCLKLHTGGVLYLRGIAFGGSTNLHAIDFIYDPDTTVEATNADGPGKSVQFELYYNGAITTRGQVKANTVSGAFGTYGPAPSLDPSWFSWN